MPKTSQACVAMSTQFGVDRHNVDPALYSQRSRSLTDRSSRRVTSTILASNRQVAGSRRIFARDRQTIPDEVERPAPTASKC